MLRPDCGHTTHITLALIRHSTFPSPAEKALSLSLHRHSTCSILGTCSSQHPDPSLKKPCGLVKAPLPSRSRDEGTLTGAFFALHWHSCCLHLSLTPYPPSLSLKGAHTAKGDVCLVTLNRCDMNCSSASLRCFSCTGGDTTTASQPDVLPCSEYLATIGARRAVRLSQN